MLLIMVVMLIYHKANNISYIDCSKFIINNIGLEIDIRDYCGELVVHHDVPKNNNLLLLKDFLAMYKALNKNIVLALNIKSNGLCEYLSTLLNEYQITNYFVFDMSIPDTLHYINCGMSFFTRQSEYELQPIFYSESAGIWLDEFKDDWITESVILGHIQNNKKVAIVSPELHKREYKDRWIFYKDIIHRNNIEDKVMLCTDFPFEF